MRTIKPIRVLPPTLKPGGAGAKAEQANLERHADNPDTSKKFAAHWNNPDVRGVLYANQGRVCAYCARSLPGGDRGDVEHYRPKKEVTEDESHSGYWWLAYKLSNYVLSCRTCNSSRKRNKFPIQNPQNRATFETDITAGSEVCALIYPKGDHLDDWFEIDLTHRHLRVIPRQNFLTPKQLIAAEQSLDFFRINTDQFLIRERLIVLERTLDAIEAHDFKTAGKLASRYSPQSLVARQVLMGSHPNHLPDTQAELSWLLERIVREFDILTEILGLDPTDERSKKELDETFWMLATLLKAPPDGDQPRVEALCEALGVKDEIAALSGSIDLE